MGQKKQVQPEPPADNFSQNSDGIEVFASLWQRKHWKDVSNTLSTMQGLVVESVAAGSQSATVYCTGGALTGNINKSAMIKIGGNYHLVAAGGTASANKVPISIFPPAPTSGYADGTQVEFCDSALEVHDFVLGANTWVYQPGFRAYQLINPSSCGYSSRPKGFFVKSRPTGTEGTDYNVVMFHPFYAAKYQMSKADATASSQGSSGVAISNQGVVPWGGIAYDDAVTASAKTDATNGKDISTRLIRDDEWVSLAVYAQLLGPDVFGNNHWEPFGNNNSLKDNDDASITFTADPTLSGRALTGTGVKSGWKIGQNLTTHTGRINGVYDLNGNVWEWTSGLKLKVGSSGAGYLFVDEADTGIQFTIANNYVTELNTDPKVANHAVAGATSTAGRDEFGQDYQYAGTAVNTEYMALRGGHWSHGSYAGSFYLYLDDVRTSSGTNVGFRAAFEV
jgi:formylglycine-generating enzyme required for sulfatase activity